MITELEERESAINNLYHAFGKRVNDEVTKFALMKTKGVRIINFLDACRQLENYSEFPRNLSREIIAISGGTRTDGLPSCPNCCVYLNGEPEISGGERIPYSAGLRKYYSDEGDIYARVGYTAPCDCVAGERVRKAFGGQ